jgi:hypothetical protein
MEIKTKTSPLGGHWSDSMKKNDPEGYRLVQNARAAYEAEARTLKSHGSTHEQVMEMRAKHIKKLEADVSAEMRKRNAAADNTPGSSTEPEAKKARVQDEGNDQPMTVGMMRTMMNQFQMNQVKPPPPAVENGGIGNELISFRQTIENNENNTRSVRQEAIESLMKDPEVRREAKEALEESEDFKIEVMDDEDFRKIVMRQMTVDAELMNKFRENVHGDGAISAKAAAKASSTALGSSSAYVSNAAASSSGLLPAFVQKNCNSSNCIKRDIASLYDNNLRVSTRDIADLLLDSSSEDLIVGFIKQEIKSILISLVDYF